jgi:hypothetical protein
MAQTRKPDQRRRVTGPCPTIEVTTLVMAVRVEFVV